MLTQHMVEGISALAPKQHGATFVYEGLTWAVHRRRVLSNSGKSVVGWCTEYHNWLYGVVVDPASVRNKRARGNLYGSTWA